jgi:hypothetical protein
MVTAGSVQAQIFERFGEGAARDYIPSGNCFTYKGWSDRGYQVKRGEKALHSMTFVADRNDPSKKIPVTINLFYKCQVARRTK